MTMITPSYLGETIEYSSLHACRSTLEDPTTAWDVVQQLPCSRCPESGRTKPGRLSDQCHFDPTKGRLPLRAAMEHEPGTAVQKGDCGYVRIRG